MSARARRCEVGAREGEGVVREGRARVRVCALARAQKVVHPVSVRFRISLSPAIAPFSSATDKLEKS